MHVGPNEQEGRYREEPGRTRPGQREQKQQQSEKKVTEVLRTSGEADRKTRRRQHGKGRRPQPAGTGFAPAGDPSEQSRRAGSGRDEPVGKGADVLYRPRQQHFETPLFGQPRAASDGVGEHIVADDGVVGEHPLPGGQLEEDVAR